MTRIKPRVLAIHLPQFHPIPENDEWWGKGFTEWTNVAKAKPLYPGHFQPQLPSELGFYDLRLPEARQAQADLAREHGIHGFCYYHYWFNGKLLLERPIVDILDSGKPDFPFCLTWANENWTRSWDGGSKQILMEQHYGDSDDEAHFRWLLPFFRDPRYIRVDGKPFFAIYRAQRLPSSQRTTDRWRELAHQAGLPGLYLCRFDSFPDERIPLEGTGFDAAVEFQPDWPYLGRVFPAYFPFWTFRRFRLLPPPLRQHVFYRYSTIVKRMMQRPPVPYKRFPCVMPGWDNTARRGESGGAVVMVGNTPELFGKWLRHTLHHFRPYSSTENLVFINAWNEWAEGNHLEPDRRWGRAFLEAAKSAIESVHG